LREGKGTAWEGGQREPTIVYFPKKISPGRVVDTEMMAIDILPTIAEITKSKLPDNKIDGKSVLKIWTGETIESPHEAYFFYYRKNDLHGVRYKNWKLYFPHDYRSLNGRIGGKNGHPVKYDINTIKEIELYNLSDDISETKNLAKKYPDVIKKIESLADIIRNELGDGLYEIKGLENRPHGKLNL